MFVHVKSQSQRSWLFDTLYSTTLMIFQVKWQLGKRKLQWTLF